MNILKQKFFAVLVMSLIIFTSLVLMAKMSIGKAIVILLFLLAIFTVIDLIVQTNVLTEKQSRLVSIAIGGVVIMGIGIFGAFTVPAIPTGNEDDLDQGKMSSSKVIDETYDLGLFYYERGDYEEAIKTLKEVANSSDSYVDAQKLIAEATDQYRSNLTETANAYAESGEYELATNILNAGLLVIPEDQELLHTIEEYSLAHTAAVRTTAIEGAKAAAENENYGEALLYVRDASNELDRDAELTALYENYAEKYRVTLIDKATSAFGNYGYEEALSIIEDGLIVLPGDEQLLTALTKYQSYMPVSVASLEIWEKDPIYGSCGPSYDSVMDNYGNLYSPYFDNGGSNIYKIDREYSQLTGVFCIKKGKNSSNDECRLYIWKIVNGKRDTLIYDAVLTGGNDPIEFSVDISDVDFLEVCVWEGYGLNGIAFVADLFVAK